MLRTRLRDLASQRRRFGYRRLHILLRREGIAVNHKKLYRPYREERLTVRVNRLWVDGHRWRSRRVRTSVGLSTSYRAHLSMAGGSAFYV